MDKKIMTLCIVHLGEKVLLGMKKRGFGEGRWNGFGGKVIEGETIEEATKREVLEETSLTVDKMEKIGIIDFSWKNKEGILEVNIFKINNFTGTPKESEEMRPEWFLVKDIPYDKMWSDDKYWLPLFLDNKKFKGNFVFDDKDNVLEHKLDEVQ